MGAETSQHWTDWWAGAAGVVVGSFIPIGLAWWSRRTERLGELDGMVADLYQGERCMQALRNEDPPVFAPLYRLPLRMFDHALPKLIGEGLLTQNEVSSLLEYVMRAEELNRGLDRAGEAHVAGDVEQVKAEYNRNILKVAHVLDVPEKRLSGLSLRDAVWDALLGLEDRYWLRRLRVSAGQRWRKVRPKLAAALTEDDSGAG